MYKGLKTTHKLKAAAANKSNHERWLQVSFSKENLDKLPPVSAKRKAHIEKIARNAMRQLRNEQAGQSHYGPISETAGNALQRAWRALKERVAYR